MERSKRYAVRAAALCLVGIASTVQAQSQPLTVREERAYPTGDRATSVILLERFTPVEVRPNQEFTYEIKLTNLTRGPVENVQLTDQAPATFTAKGVAPQPVSSAGGQSTWSWRSLGPNASESIRVTGSTAQMQELSWCATVTFSTLICAKTRIVEPKLVLEKTMPPQAMLCEEIPIKVTVRNTGTGSARGVQVTDTMPDGLAGPDGKNSFMFNVGELAAGQAREMNLTARAARTGDFCNKATVREESGFTAEASACVKVTRPVLAVTKTGPNMRYLGRNATFDINVQNTGDAPARDTVLTDAVPAGMEVVGADGGGRAAGGNVTWALGTLEPGASRRVQITLKPTQIGRMNNVAVAKAYCAEAQASVPMDVMGIPAILLECVDNPDPVEVGGTTTYTIVVTNQGSATGTNIVIDCTLPPEQDYVTAQGPTQAAVAGKNVRFAPLPTLAAKARATYTVTVKGLNVGDVRFKVSMKSDQTETPVEETESTHIY